MTTEEKAKAYDTIIQRVTELYETGTSLTMEQMEHLFPELRESKDEMIRKEIINYLDFAESHNLLRAADYEKKKGWLAYLEKQKEKKPEIKYVYPKFRKGDVIEPITPNGHCEPVRVVGIWDGSYSCRSDDDRAYLSLPIKHEDEYRLVEQKSALTPERIHPKFAVGDTVCRPMWSDHTIREIYVRCNDPVYVCVNEEGTESHISFSEQDEWERKEQKPAEWSEEDEDKLEQCIRIVSGWERDYDIVKSPYSNFLKSIRPSWKLQRGAD